MLVREIMTSEPVCCTPDTSIADAAKLMADYDCGELPVCESENSDRLVGVITDRDICCRAVAKSKDPDTTTVRECMSSPVVTVVADADVGDCCEVMEQNQVRRVPVVDEDGSCCGIVSQADIARRTGKEAAGEVVREVSKPLESPSAV